MGKMASRLDSVVLLHHTGHERSYAVTGTFKILPFRFQRVKLARALPPGWYILTKRLASTSVVVRSFNEVRPADSFELRDISRRMRIRFGKLLKGVKDSKKRKITDDLMIVAFKDVLFLTEQNWFIYVMVLDDGEINLMKLPRARIYDAMKGYEDEYVTVYLANSYAGIIHFTTAP